MSIRQEIENGLIDLISSNLLIECNPVQGYLQLVGPYNGELDQIEGPDDFTRIVRGRWPCVLVHAGSATIRAKSAQRTRFNRIISLELYVGSDHRRDYESRLRKDVSAENDPNCDPGIYQIVEDLNDLLAGNDLGLECVGYLDPSREEVLLQEQGYTIWRMQFTVETEARVPKRDAGDVKLTQYRIDGNLDPDEVTTPPNPFVEAEGDL